MPDERHEERHSDGEGLHDAAILRAVNPAEHHVILKPVVDLAVPALHQLWNVHSGVTANNVDVPYRHVSLFSFFRLRLVSYAGRNK